MKSLLKHILPIVVIFISIGTVNSQTAIWIEDFDDGGGGRWVLENAPGSKTNPTPDGTYVFHVGSDNSDGETYFEPIRCIPNGLLGPDKITARFLDLTPNLSAVVPSIPFGLPPTLDTIEMVET